MAAAAGLPSSPPLPAGAQGGERLREMGKREGERVWGGVMRETVRERRRWGGGLEGSVGFSLLPLASFWCLLARDLQPSQAKLVRIICIAWTMDTHAARVSSSCWCCLCLVVVGARLLPMRIRVLDCRPSHDWTDHPSDPAPIPSYLSHTTTETGQW